MKSAMTCSVVDLQSISGPESFLAEVAGDGNSFDMVCFNVVLYGVSLALLTTNFALVSFLLSVGVIVFTFLHH